MNMKWLKQFEEMHQPYFQFDWESEEYESKIPRLVSFNKSQSNQIKALLELNKIEYKASTNSDLPNYSFYYREFEFPRPINISGPKNFLSIDLESDLNVEKKSKKPKIYNIWIEVDDDEWFWVHVFYQYLPTGSQHPSYENVIYKCDDLWGLFKLLKKLGVIEKTKSVI